MDSRGGLWGQAVQKLEGTALSVENQTGTPDYRKKMVLSASFAAWLPVMIPELRRWTYAGWK